MFTITVKFISWYTVSGRYIPHVMTLFDRKVDLARFNQSTPLYVMCREWMCNNPEKMVLTNGTANNTEVRALHVSCCRTDCMRR